VGSAKRGDADGGDADGGNDDEYDDDLEKLAMFDIGGGGKDYANY
jgi:hypothetical protein